MTFSFEHNFSVSLSDISKHALPFYNNINYVPTNYITCFMGFPLVPTTRGDFIVFVKCEFCGQTDGKLENNRCGHCGGWIS